MPGPLPFRSKLLFNTPADLAQFDATPLITGDHATVLDMTPSAGIDARVGFSLVREDSTSIVDNINIIAVGPSGLGEGRWRRASAHLNTFRRVTTTDATPVFLSMGVMAPAQSIVTVVDITAHDDIGQQTAFLVTGIPFARFGNGPILINGSPFPIVLPLSYAPNVAPWNTIAASFDGLSGTFEIFVTLVGLAGVTIDWVVNLEYRTTEVGQ